jgi:hypothetical protein
MEVESVDGVASGVNRLLPKPILCFVLIKHGPCHMQKSYILPLHYTILLRCVGRRELMLDALFLKNPSICEFLNSVLLSLLIFLILNPNSF